MPSDILKPRGEPIPSRFHEDIHITPELGSVKNNKIPEGGGDRSSNLQTSYQMSQRSSLSAAVPAFIPNGRTTSETHWESSLFSSSLSDLFTRKLMLPRSDNLAFMSENHDEEPSESLEEIGAKIFGNLFPDEDDLFTEVVGEGVQKSRANGGFDDCDLFSSVGGMELDGDVFSSACLRDRKSGSDVLLVGQHPKGESVSRTLFVSNVDSVIEDSELNDLFMRYGDVWALHTTGKNRGFIMVSYYDIRAAEDAVKALHGRLYRGRKLHIHYSMPQGNPDKGNSNEGALWVNNIDSSLSDEELDRIFSHYGQIREVRRTMHENSPIYIEFFDVQSVEAALRGLNGLEIAGRQLKLSPACPEVTSLSPQFAADDGEAGLAKLAFNNLSSAHMGRHIPGTLAPTSFDGGYMGVMHNSVASPVNSFIQHHQSLDIPIGLPPSARVISASKPVGLQEPGNYFDNSNSGIQSMPNLHPHFPDYLDNFAIGSPYKSSQTFSEMVIDGQKANEGFMMSNVQDPHRPNLNSWSNSNTQQHNPSSGMMWSNSPSYVNGIPSQHIPFVTSFSRASPLMANMASSPVHHHIGSAPLSSGFHLGSHGSMGFPGSSPSHPVDIGSHRVVSHVGGKNAVLRSSRQMPQPFTGRSPVSFDLPNERYRNHSQRRSESSSSNAEKKQFELDVDRILRGEDSRTTLMIKNIPNKYTSKMLLATIDEYCKGTYDFLYLPIDFKNKCNVGYAFINLTEPKAVVLFYQAFNGKRWEKFNSEKVAYLAYGRIQGKSALIAHFQNSSLMNEDKRCRPILFHTSGPNAGDQEPFPMGTNIRSRPGKHRTSNNEN